MSFSKTILKNTLFNWAGMILNTLIVFLLTPYILRHLGAERYGIYSLVFSVMHYMVLMELGIRGSVARFASKYIQANDISALNSVISVALLLGVSLGFLSLPLSFLIGKAAIYFFKIAPVLHVETMALFLAFGLEVGFSLLSYSFLGVLIGSQRYDLVNFRLVLVALLNVGFLVIFFSNAWNNLLSLAAGMVLSSGIGLCVLYFCAKFLHPGLSIGLKYIRWKILKEMFQFGKWNLLVQISTLVNASANQIIIGKYLGPASVPLYSIPYQVIVRLQSLISGMTSTLMPIASSALNTGDKKLLAYLLQKGTYSASVILFPIGGCLLVMARDLFRVWLPAEYLFSWVVFVVLLASYLMAITQTTSYYILLGGGEIKGLSIMSLVGSLSLIILSILSASVWKLGLLGVTASLSAVQLFIHGIFQSWYLTRQLKISFFDYLWKSYKKPLFCAVPAILSAALLVFLFPPPDLVIWGVEYFVSLIPFVFLGLIVLDDLPVIAPIQKKIRSYF